MRERLIRALLAKGFEIEKTIQWFKSFDLCKEDEERYYLGIKKDENISNN